MSRLAEIHQSSADRLFLSAVERGDFQGVKKALASGAHVNITDNIGQTALIAASRKGDKRIVELLIKNRSDVNAKMAVGYDPRWDWDSELASADSGYERMVAVSAETGDVGVHDINGRTALIEAAGNGHTEIVEILIENGADVDAKTERNQLTALKAASINNHKETVELLKKHGAEE